MKKLFNWVVWFSAGILALLLFAALLSSSLNGNGQNQLTFSVIAVSILIGLSTQIGLFLTPWAIYWHDRYQKIIFFAMLPSIFWLVYQISYDGSEFLSDSKSGMNAEVYTHGIEAVVLVGFLLIYAIQGFRVSADFLRKPSAGEE